MIVSTENSNTKKDTDNYFFLFQLPDRLAACGFKRNAGGTETGLKFQTNFNTEKMNSTLQTYKIPDEITTLAEQFCDARELVDQLMRVSITGVEQSRWKRLHDHLFDLLVEGNDISGRINTYCDVGRIPGNDAKMLALKLDFLYQSATKLKKYIGPQTHSNSIFLALHELEKVSLKLRRELQAL